MLASPSYAIVGATDPAKTVRFLAHFGFESAAEKAVSRSAATALYGLEEATTEIILRCPGAENGWIQVVETPYPARRTDAYDARPVAIDLYTRDISKSLDIARRAGADAGELVEYSLGPLKIKEVEVVGPDHLVIVFIQVNKLRPSVLDHAPDKLHSEVHSIVLAVQDAEAALPFWTRAAGLSTLIDSKIEGPIISRLMSMPRPEVPVRFVLMCDEESRPARLELLDFFEDPGHQQPTWPLTAGLYAPGFTVEDLDQVLRHLKEAEFGAITAVGSGRAITGVAPGQVRFELRES